MSKFESFIYDSTFDRPRTITYGNYSIVSKGNLEHRKISLYRCGINMFDMHLNICYDCEIHVCGVFTDLSYRHKKMACDWLNDTCTTYVVHGMMYDEYWKYETWDDVDKLMWKIVDYIRNRS